MILERGREKERYFVVGVFFSIPTTCSSVEKDRYNNGYRCLLNLVLGYFTLSSSINICNIFAKKSCCGSGTVLDDRDANNPKNNNNDKGSEEKVYIYVFLYVCIEMK